MCGIFCSVSFKPSRAIYDLKNIQKSLKKRGPDYSHCFDLELEVFNFFFSASLLHMQGINLEPQPVVTSHKDILLYNGELFNGIEVPKETSDTDVLANLLKCNSEPENISKTLELIEGPWSLIYFQHSTKKLWFGRDYFGRRSLLMTLSSDNVGISSVACRPAVASCETSWFEVPTGLHCLDLSSGNSLLHSYVFYPWKSVINGLPKIDVTISKFSNSKHETCLMGPVSRRYANSTPIIQEPECFLKVKADSPLENLVAICDFKNLWNTCRQFITKLEKAVARRTKLLEWENASKLGVLFSGGIDCTVLAYLAHRSVPENEPIDLLNVSFEQRKPVSDGVAQEPNFVVPDRVTGVSSLKELRRLCPNRQWNFVEVNVKVEELREYRQTCVADLTYPKQTVLDDSIACALWFASRGKGLLVNEDGTKDSYHSPVRILLCGMGADEQLGGYARHRTVYSRSESWNAVNDEINMEVERISSRNLGRDDRIISDHGREARFPYLDEEVVGFLLSLPVYQKTDFRYPRGIGEKILLRGSAYLLGFREAAVLPKRAIQFGSKIAKAEGDREKGSDTCRRLVG